MNGDSSARTSKPMTATQINAIQEEALGLMRELNEYAQKHYRSQPRCTCDLMSICTRLYSALIKRLGSSSDETSERCHFRAFGRFACELPKDHAGDHTCRLPEDPPQQAFTDQARVDEQVFQDMLIHGLGFTMHVPAGRRRLPPHAVTIDLDILHASEAGAGGEPGLATQATVTESRQADRCLATRVPRQIDASARHQTRVDVLTNEQCDRIISELQAQEWSGISRDDVRLWDGLITSMRLESSPKASQESGAPRREAGDRAGPEVSRHSGGTKVHCPKCGGIHYLSNSCPESAEPI